MSAKIKPIITFVLTQILLAFVISAAAYFILEQKEIKPRYAISTPEMIAEATVDTPRLKLLWDNEEVQNVYSLKIAIWNAGREYLDTASISATDPIRVIYPPGVEILYADFIRTSRGSLSLTATDLSNTGTRAIQIQIVGDEALEQKDGGVLKILYTGQSSDEFAVTGRIKGSKQGFKEVSWNIATRTLSSSNIITPVIWFASGLFLVVSIIKRSRGRIALDTAFDLAMATLFLIMGVVLIYALIRDWLVSLHWIT